MEDFEFHSPTKVLFGKGAETRVGAEIASRGFHRVLVHFGGTYLAETGVLDRIHQSLTDAGLSYLDLGGVVPNPRLSHAKEGVALCKKEGVDFILGVGGGSVLDTAKALAAGLPRPEVPVWDYYSGKEKPITAIPVGAVLTIAAAGSETSDSTVLTNEATQEKRGFNSEWNRPRFAILNPELTYTLPPYQTACGVADILMHTLDRYFSDVQGNELTDALAEAILRTTVRFGKTALVRPDDYEARSELMWCGSLSHNNLTGLGRTKDFTVHQLGHELSGRYGMAHGASLAIMWPAWARQVWTRDPARFARLGRTVFGVSEEDDGQAALAAIAAVEACFRDLGLPVSLGQSEAGVIPEEELEALALGCSRGRSRSVGSFCPLDHDGLLAVYRAANH